MDLDQEADKVYKSRSTCPKQIHFPARSTNIRSSRTTSKQATSYLQCTLTQLETVDSSACPRRTPLQREESMMARTLKRQASDKSNEGRKRSRNSLPALSDSQRTLTQLVSSSFSALDELEPFVDEDVPIAAIRADNQEEVIPETQWPLRKESTTSSNIIDEVEVAPISEKVRRTDTRMLPIEVFSTPIKEKSLEIPPSHSPQSTLLRTERSRRNLYGPEETPTKSQRSLNMIMGTKALENVPQQRMNINDGLKDAETTFIRPAPPSSRRKTVIADSQITQSPLELPKLIHKSTIPDSQADEDEQQIFLSLSKPSAQLIEKSNDGRNQSIMQSSNFAFTQFGYTIDPAYGALDRDAERFLAMDPTPLVDDDSVCVPGTNIPFHISEDSLLPPASKDQGEVRSAIIDQVSTPKKNQIDLTSDHNYTPLRPVTPTISVISQDNMPVPKSSIKRNTIGPSRPSQVSTILDSESPSPPTISLFQNDNPVNTNPEPAKQPVVYPSSSPLPMPFHSSPVTPRTGRSVRSRRYFMSLYTSDADVAPSPSSTVSTHLQSIRSPGKVILFEDSDEENRQTPHLPPTGLNKNPKRASNLLADDKSSRRSKKRPRRRMQRADEILPDSLLDFSIPAAPPWTSSPALRNYDELPVDKVVDGDNDDNNQGDMEDIKVKVDYSLVAPSSEWRSSNRV